MANETICVWCGEFAASCGCPEPDPPGCSDTGGSNSIPPFNPLSSSSPPSSSGPVQAGTRVVALIDWIGFALEGSWNAERGPVTQRMLEAFQLKAQQAEDEAVPVEFFGEPVLVQPYGAGTGNARCAFSLKVAGCSVRLRFKEGGALQGWVDAPSFALLANGAEGLLSRLNRWFDAIGLQVARRPMNRGDTAFDVLDGPSAEDFFAALAAKRVVTRCRQFSTYGEISDGVLMQYVRLGAGGAPVNCRVYDKLHELERDPEKRRLLEARIWNASPAAVTRVEFQCRADALRKSGIATVEDFIRLVGSHATYLVTKWLRVCEDEVDRTNTTRERVADWWRKIGVAAASTWGAVSAAACVKVQAPAEQLVKQAAGCLRSAMARMRTSIEDGASWLYEVVRLLDPLSDKAPRQVQALELAFVASRGGG